VAERAFGDSPAGRINGGFAAVWRASPKQVARKATRTQRNVKNLHNLIFHGILQNSEIDIFLLFHSSNSHSKHPLPSNQARGVSLFFIRTVSAKSA
jgi:hypothetical protein